MLMDNFCHAVKHILRDDVRKFYTNIEFVMIEFTIRMNSIRKILILLFAISTESQATYISVATVCYEVSFHFIKTSHHMIGGGPMSIRSLLCRQRQQE